LKTFHFYCMRHAAYKDDEDINEDELTNLGFRQVEIATKQLTTVQFSYAYSSGKKRAIQTVNHALRILGQDLSSVNMEGFDYDWIADEDWDGFDEAYDVVAEAQGTAGDFILKWSFAVTMGEHFRQALLEVAQDVSQHNDLPDPVNVLVASHSPPIELSAADPSVIPLLDNCDIVLHKVDVADDSNAVLVSSKYLPCPPLK